MENYHVVYQDKGWEVLGADRNLTFDTKKSAVIQAKIIALQEGRSVVIHTQDGKISRVVSNGRRFAKGRRIRSANVKRKLRGKNVRNSIAIAMSERSK
ncbi:MAG: DUF2188 domain-containing protein [Fulvivirga sp.]